MRYLLVIMLLFISCKEQENKDLSAQQIVDKAIEKAGGDKYKNADISFTFREIKYTSHRKNGLFEITRSFADSLGEVKDVLSNSGFSRYRNSEKIALADSLTAKYANSLNSVHYFVQLPFGLNDPAVEKEKEGDIEIKGKDYYAIKVTFNKEGGGTDHDDVYMYWINKNDFTVDYFAYKFYSGTGGIRFREAYNPRIIEGIRFVDYKNYKIEPWESVELKSLGNLFDADKLELLSDIKTEDIIVNDSLEK